MGKTDWWRTAIGYEVYVSSFADSNGDGLGDLAGVEAHLDHLHELGIDLIWLTPFFPSPLKDQGYDISDYLSVDPRFGTLDDLDRLVASAHARGMRVVFDLVVNHSSSEHPWFVESRSAENNDKRDWYIWREGRDGAAGQEPPNNWVSYFGGSAWTFDDTTKQWYLHLFLPEQPDLNWANPAVGDAISTVIDFWMQRGIDGFRVDTGQLFAKHPDFPDNPARLDVPTEYGAGRVADHERQEHLYEVDQPHALDAHRTLGRSTHAHGGVLIGEVYLPDPKKVVRYVEGQDGMNLSFFFGLVEFGWNPDRIVREIEAALVLAPHVAWVLSSHDSPRAAGRYAFDTSDRGRERALVLHTLLFCLPGMPFLYQGEELGLTNGIVPPDRVRDPIALAGEIENARDIARTPMPWRPGSPMLGFTSASDAWLPLGGRTDADTAAVQRADPQSWLTRYRELIAFRRAHPELATGTATIVDRSPDHVVIVNGRVTVRANLTDTNGRLTARTSIIEVA
jgi:alpha-glucosidase